MLNEAVRGWQQQHGLGLRSAQRRTSWRSMELRQSCCAAAPLALYPGEGEGSAMMGSEPKIGRYRAIEVGQGSGPQVHVQISGSTCLTMPYPRRTYTSF